MTGKEIELPGGRKLVVRGANVDVAKLATLTDPDEVYSEQAKALIDDGIAKNTKSTFLRYARFIVRFGGESKREVLPMTPATLIELLLDLETRPGRYNVPNPDGTMPPFRPLAPETVRMYFKVISRAHRLAIRPEKDSAGRSFVGYESPTKHPDVQRAYRGYVKRWLGAGHRPDKASAITPAELKRMIGTLDLRANRDLRDAAVLAVGFDGGFRKNELCDIQLQDVVFVTGVDGREFMVVTVPMSKTDQGGEGAEVFLAAHPVKHASTCPVRLTKLWIERCAEQGLTNGPLFRNLAGGGPPPSKDPNRPRRTKILAAPMPESSVTSAIDRTAAAADLVVAGMPARQRRHIVPHSLRHGSARAAAAAGARASSINSHYRWSQRGTTGQQYEATGSKLRENVSEGIWTSESTGDPDSHGADGT